MDSRSFDEYGLPLGGDSDRPGNGSGGYSPDSTDSWSGPPAGTRPEAAALTTETPTPETPDPTSTVPPPAAPAAATSEADEQPAAPAARAPGASSAAPSSGQLPTLDELLGRLVDLDGSDLHLKVGSPPCYRIDGSLHFAELRSLRPADTADFADQVMPDHLRDRFADEGEADFAYGKRDLGRFRVNCYKQRGSINVVLRAVTPVTKSFEELGLPASVEKMADAEWGIVIVNGRAGSGKSTTLGAMIDHVNSTRRVNIITLEDPIEMLHSDKQSIVSQREIGLDTASYAEGMRRALRQDANVIFMGEMRNRETMEAAMQAAETGKLVLTSMLTADAVETVTRIIEAFPPFQQQQIRQTLATLLKGVVSHRLVPRADGAGRALAAEVLAPSERVYERIVDPALSPKLLDAIVDGGFHGMQSFDQALLKLIEQRIVSMADALAHATDPTDVKLAAQALGFVG